MSIFLAKDADWDSKFHIWRMDWDESALKIYIDGELINEVSLDDTVNGTVGNGTNPMRQPHYFPPLILLWVATMEEISTTVHCR